MRHQILRECLLSDIPREIVAPEPEIEEHAAPLSIPHDIQHLAFLVQHLTEIAMIKVGDHVTTLGDAESVRGKQMVRRRQLEFADVHIERQI